MKKFDGLTRSTLAVLIAFLLALGVSVFIIPAAATAGADDAIAETVNEDASPAEQNGEEIVEIDDEEVPLMPGTDVWSNWLLVIFLAAAGTIYMVGFLIVRKKGGSKT